MLTPIRCFSCGFPIGYVADQFREIRRERINKQCEKLKLRPEEYMLDPDVSVEMGDVLDDLRIYKICCRTRLITGLEFWDYN